ncbi:MAG: hypothetical protein EBY29_15360, partial [Planctomycetes bacterium]|nr:hypothetical protein [Planctomycetota bacterium]
MSDAYKFVVFDMDGTLADCSHRLQYAQSKQWDEFHSRSKDDDVIVRVADLMVVLASVADIIILTGRPEKYRPVTQQWLDDYRTRANQPLSVVASNSYRRYLSVFCNYCVKSGWMASNPLVGVRPRKLVAAVPRLL